MRNAGGQSELLRQIGVVLAHVSDWVRGCGGGPMAATDETAGGTRWPSMHAGDCARNREAKRRQQKRAGRQLAFWFDLRSQRIRATKVCALGASEA
jgi:hypothetical protein